MTPEQYVETGDTVTVLGRHLGRTRAGRELDVPFVHVWRLKDGRAVSFTEFFDTARMNALLGADETRADVPGQPDRAGARAPQQA